MNISVVNRCGWSALVGSLVQGALAGSGFVQHNLVSDQVGVADHLDPDLVNAWGISASPSGPFWVSDNGTGKTTLYNSSGVKQGLIVGIPGDGSLTGQAFHSGTEFHGDVFYFASEDGTISGWRFPLGTTAEVLRAGTAGTYYKGITVAGAAGNAKIYAANFGTGAIDQLATDGSFLSFSDPNAPVGYKPFNIQSINGNLYVTFALANGIDDLPAAGHGYVDKFDPASGTFTRLVSGGDLNSPWGLATAPSAFGAFAGDLLVGNFGDGKIHAYDPNSGAAKGVLKDLLGNDIVIDGLWGLSNGNGGNGGDKDKLYFSAGPGGEAHGLFGSLQAVPEPTTFALVGLAALVAKRKRRH